jgi:hypothetical protein
VTQPVQPTPTTTTEAGDKRAHGVGSSSGTRWVPSRRRQGSQDQRKNDPARPPGSRSRRSLSAGTVVEECSEGASGRCWPEVFLEVGIGNRSPHAAQCAASIGRMRHGSRLDDCIPAIAVGSRVRALEKAHHRDTNCRRAPKGLAAAAASPVALLHVTVAKVGWAVCNNYRRGPKERVFGSSKRPARLWFCSRPIARAD